MDAEFIAKRVLENIKRSGEFDNFRHDIFEKLAASVCFSIALISTYILFLEGNGRMFDEGSEDSKRCIVFCGR